MKTNLKNYKYIYIHIHIYIYIYTHTHTYMWASQMVLVVKNTPVNEKDKSHENSISESGRSSG